MKKFVIACITAAAFYGVPARAAEMAVKAAPPAPVAAAISWTGFYVGVNGGYRWSNRSTVTNSANDPDAAGNFGNFFAPAEFNMRGTIGGLEAGYNWQFNQNWLTGIETDFDWSTIKNGAIRGFSGPAGANGQIIQSDRSFGSIRGRLGFLPANNLLIYGTAGFAYGRVTQSENVTNATAFTSVSPPFGVSCVGGGTTCLLGNSSRIATGWTAGTGLEYALWRNVSVKADYLYVNLGGGDRLKVAALNTGGGTTPASFTANFSGSSFHVLRGGLNIKF